MTVIVFAGPTISAAEVRAWIAAEVLPPVAQGDVYRAVRQGARAIGIVDGYFDRVPAVWHKEIFWALSEGIPVYGSASMGALRAAELAPFGMIGVGAIFEAFRSGSLEDDDEVAVVHSSEEDGYRCGSEAMVNVRATVASAQQRNILCEATARVLISIAKAAYYAERSYLQLTAAALERGLPSAEIFAFREWLKLGAVNQKQMDATAMLARMKVDLGRPRVTVQPPLPFEATNAWQIAMADSESRITPSQADKDSTNILEPRVLEEFALFGPYAPARAAHKQKLVDALAFSAAEEEAALEWYFVRRVRRTLPDDLDAYAREIGLPDGAAFRRAVAREFLYVRRTESLE